MKRMLFENVTTNNLKGVTVSIDKEKITAVVGCSGSGKSSLAYGTIYELCAKEFRALEDGYLEQSQARVEKYSSLVPAVALRQLNNITNPRSTIFSHLNVGSIISLLCNTEFSTLPLERVKLNAFGNECELCHGEGASYKIDEGKIVDNSKTILENPFRNWQNSRNDKKHKILIEFCKIKSIPLNVEYLNLSDDRKEVLLYGTSSKKIPVSFKANGKSRKRSEFFVGAAREAEDELSSSRKSDRNHAEKYAVKGVCRKCNGSKIKIDSVIMRSRVVGLPYHEFLSMPFDRLYSYIKKVGYHRIRFSPIVRLVSLVRAMCEIGIGYLSFSRSMPSLSGGELQKLNFSRLLTTEMAGFLVVLDEVSAGLHISDYPIFVDKIKGLSAGGVGVILVEHSEYFIRHADKVIRLGPGSGRDGGRIVANRNQYVGPDASHRNRVASSEAIYQTPPIFKNNIKNVSLKFRHGDLVGICGKSGSGKSSFFRGLSEVEPKFHLVSQEIIKPSSRSSVATYVGATALIASSFSGVSGSDEEWFLPSAGKKGACPQCDGKGVISIPRAFEETIVVTCELCDGRLFNQEADAIKTNCLSISTFYASPISELQDLDFLSPALSSRVRLLDGLGLGHLSFGRRTNTLSGGEMRRLKLVDALLKRKKDHFLVVDEVGAGLDDVSIQSVMDYLSSHKDGYRNIILIDHKPDVILACDYIYEFGPGSAENGGKIVFEGSGQDFSKRRLSKYLS